MRKCFQPLNPLNEKKFKTNLSLFSHCIAILIKYALDHFIALNISQFYY